VKGEISWVTSSHLNQQHKPLAMGFTGIGLTLALPQSGPYSCKAFN